MKRKEIMESRQLAGRVVRYHTWPMIRKPNVAESSSRVATLYVELWGMPRAEVLYYCLLHDHGEFTAGDTPFLAKGLAPGLREGLNIAEQEGLRRLGLELPEISQEEFRRFKVCDLLEMFEAGMVEWRMGNTYAGPVIVDTVRTVQEMLRQFYKEYAHVKNWVYSNGYQGEAAYGTL